MNQRGAGYCLKLVIGKKHVFAKLTTYGVLMSVVWALLPTLYLIFLTQPSENMTVAPIISPLKGPDCCLEVGNAESTPDM